MAKKPFAVEVEGEQGRLHNIRKTNGRIIGTFIGRTNTKGRDVPVEKVTCLHAKSAQHLTEIIRELK